MPPTRTKKKFGKAHSPLGADVVASKLAKPGKEASNDFGGEEDEGLTAMNQEETRKLFELRREQEEEMLEEEDEEEEVELEYDDHTSVATELTYQMPEFEVDPGEEQLMEQFMPSSIVQSKNLIDVIMEKIRQKERGDREETASQMSAGSEQSLRPQFEPKVMQVYKAVGRVLSRYKSGRLPKAFKILPNLQQWEELLLITNPQNWTPNAMYAATRIFASNLNERMAQRFYCAVLLPSLHEFMKENRVLNVHYYNSIRKALFKPAAFFRGFLIPLCRDGECNLREAIIYASVLTKVHIPQKHAAAAIILLARLPYSGATSIFLRALIDKGHSLPPQVIDELVRHFGLMLKERRELPVLWHQSLLILVQKYNDGITDPQIELIRKVAAKHNHRLISPEIHRELYPRLEKIRKEREKQAAMAQDGVQ